MEDAAQDFGAGWQGKRTGSTCNLAALSFFPSKNLVCFGDAKMITAVDGEMVDLARCFRPHGGKNKYDVEHIGYNLRLDSLQAAILLVKLKYVDRWNRFRRMIALSYNVHLKDLEWLKVPEQTAGAEHVYHQYTLRMPEGRREYVQKKLKEKGISSAV